MSENLHKFPLIFMVGNAMMFNKLLIFIFLSKENFMIIRRFL